MTNYDKLLIAIVLILSISGIYMSKTFIDNSDSKYIYIEVEGKKYKEIVFDEALNMTLDIKTRYGFNKLVIESGTVRVTEASCKDKLDVKQGEISKIGDMIVCLPNKLLIEIRGNEAEREIDYMSY